MARQGIMLAKPFEERHLKRFGPSLLCQPKINGIRCRAILDYNKGETTLWSSEGNLIISVPYINEQLESVRELWFTGCHYQIESKNGIIHLDGELYIHKMPLQDIRSITGRTVNLHPDHEKMEYHVFDLIDGYDQEARNMILHTYMDELSKPPNIRRLKSLWISNKMERVTDLLHQFMDEGYEGIIVRNPLAPYSLGKTSNMLKWKPRHTDTYDIIGYFEAISKHGSQTGMLGGLELQDSNGNKFKCGGGNLLHYERITMLEKMRYYGSVKGGYTGLTAVIKYPELTNRGIPSHPILVEIKEKL